MYYVSHFGNHIASAFMTPCGLLIDGTIRTTGPRKLFLALSKKLRIYCILLGKHYKKWYFLGIFLKEGGGVWDS